ncbi:unnamed protein product [Rotaria sp. Silwood1]|nr:unnamed protein product [Rotaria sp. Silwood1]CAF1166274.1 unnamed protein product [Rotaria sp. Silwood1]CAF3458952.1 unnamed protein product [Rotaria sp. Silwood1]CAF3465767.1 unnamed protein product [Rotaria sp. Silwood1]CAF4521527.1 unnamed protein product [Rotaria sp. Silwood1]
MGGISSQLLPLVRDSSGGNADYLVGEVIDIHGYLYKFRRRLGKGGFGAVYAATGPDGDSVAVKVIDISRVPSHRAPGFVESYLTEVKHLEKLRQESNHVVHIYDFDFDPDYGLAYIVMELGGESLLGLVNRLHKKAKHRREPGTYINPVVRQSIWRQMVTIVRTLIENNVVHMDLKPDNLILFGRTLKIIDLGLAQKPHVGSPAFGGTPQFSAPEVMDDPSAHGHSFSSKSDIWSLGAILYFMTYGVPPKYHHRAADPPHGQKQARDRHLVDILRLTLVTDPHGRADIHTLLHHPYTKRHK